MVGFTRFWGLAGPPGLCRTSLHLLYSFSSLSTQAWQRTLCYGLQRGTICCGSRGHPKNTYEKYCFTFICEMIQYRDSGEFYCLNSHNSHGSLECLLRVALWTPWSGWWDLRLLETKQTPQVHSYPWNRIRVQIHTYLPTELPL